MFNNFKIPTVMNAYILTKILVMNSVNLKDINMITLDGYDDQTHLNSVFGTGYRVLQGEIKGDSTYLFTSGSELDICCDTIVRATTGTVYYMVRMEK